MIDRTEAQLQRLASLAFEACSDIGIVKLGELSESSSESLNSARKAADRIKTLLDEEFISGPGGGLVEMERQ
jgi:hypothetical protein